MTQHHWQDARLKLALKHAPDAQAQPSAEVRAHILQAAARNRSAQKTSTNKNWLDVIVDFFHPKSGQPWGAAFGTLLVVGCVGIVWYVANPQSGLDGVLDPPYTETSLADPSLHETTVAQADSTPAAPEHDVISPVNPAEEKSVGKTASKLSPPVSVGKPSTESEALKQQPAVAKEKRAEVAQQQAQAKLSKYEQQDASPAPAIVEVPAQASVSASVSVPAPQLEVSGAIESAQPQQPAQESSQETSLPRNEDSNITRAPTTLPAAEVATGASMSQTSNRERSSASSDMSEVTSYEEAINQQPSPSKTAEAASLPAPADRQPEAVEVETQPLPATHAVFAQLVQDWKIAYISVNERGHKTQLKSNQKASHVFNLFLKGFTTASIGQATIDPDKPYQTMAFYGGKGQYLGTLTIQQGKYWSFGKTAPCTYNCQPAPQPTIQGHLSSQQLDNLRYIDLATK